MEEPHLSIPVREYIDREIRRQHALTETQFVSAETARKIASEIIARELEALRTGLTPLAQAAQRAEGSATTARWFAPSGPAILATVISILALLIAAAAFMSR